MDVYAHLILMSTMERPCSVSGGPNGAMALCLSRPTKQQWGARPQSSWINPRQVRAALNQRNIALKLEELRTATNKPALLPRQERPKLKSRKSAGALVVKDNTSKISAKQRWKSASFRIWTGVVNSMEDKGKPDDLPKLKREALPQSPTAPQILVEQPTPRSSRNLQRHMSFTIKATKTAPPSPIPPHHAACKERSQSVPSLPSLVGLLLFMKGYMAGDNDGGGDEEDEISELTKEKLGRLVNSWSREGNVKLNKLKNSTRLFLTRPSTRAAPRPEKDPLLSKRRFSANLSREARCAMLIGYDDLLVDNFEQWRPSYRKVFQKTEPTSLTSLIGSANKRDTPERSGSGTQDVLLPRIQDAMDVLDNLRCTRGLHVTSPIKPSSVKHPAAQFIRLRNDVRLLKVE